MRSTLAACARWALCLVSMGCACQPDIGFYDPQCMTNSTVLDSLESSGHMGFSASELLATATGPHSMDLRWGAPLVDGPVVVEFGPQTEGTQLSFEVVYRGGEIRELRSRPENARSNEAGDPELDAILESLCPDGLEVDVELVLATSDATLDERLAATIVGRVPEVVHLNHQIEWEELAGMLHVARLEPSRRAKLQPLSVSMTLTPFETKGEITTRVQVHGDDYLLISHVDVARWPMAPSPCTQGLYAPTDAPFAGFSALEVLTQLERMPALEMSSTNGERVGLTASFSHAFETACFSLKARDDARWSVLLELPGTLRLTTSDGELDHDFAVSARALPDSIGSLQSIELGIDSGGGWMTVSQFHATFGLHRLDLSGFDLVTLSGSATVTPHPDAPHLSGQLVVRGGRTRPCGEDDGDGHTCLEGMGVIAATLSFAS